MNIVFLISAAQEQFPLNVSPADIIRSAHNRGQGRFTETGFFNNLAERPQITILYDREIPVPHIYYRRMVLGTRTRVAAFPVQSFSPNSVLPMVKFQSIFAPEDELVIISDYKSIIDHPFELSSVLPEFRTSDVSAITNLGSGGPISVSNISTFSNSNTAGITYWKFANTLFNSAALLLEDDNETTEFSISNSINLVDKSAKIIKSYSI
jgi:hypothetical protein